MFYDLYRCALIKMFRAKVAMSQSVCPIKGLLSEVSYGVAKKKMQESSTLRPDQRKF